MARPATSTYAVLGLLSFAPMSGYQTARAVERTISYFWPISKTHVYSELARLEELGWVEGDDVRQERLPDKRVFSITSEGERALDAWLLESELPSDVHRVPLLVKLFVAHRIPLNRTREMIANYRSLAEAELRALEEIMKILEPEPKAVFGRATALLGVRMTEAVVRWADEVEGLLPARRFSIDPRRKTAYEAREIFEASPPVPTRPKPKRKRG